MKDWLLYLLHGTVLDGYKKCLGGALHLASLALKGSKPELASQLEVFANVFLGWGVASDTLKLSTK